MEPANLTFELLEEITDGFSEERMLGRGSYGKVYKGTHKNEEIAVKILNDQLDDEWFKELHNHMGLNHPNIVRVVGYCNERKYIQMDYKGKLLLVLERHRALCLEYMHNGSLQTHLSDECDGLDWHTRYKIIKGTCEGLKYLHEGYRVPIFHLDLKPDNILLDRNMVPKLADFGLSPFGTVQTLAIRGPVGTIGYLPPEYIDSGRISRKTDIFSLGVVMVKIIAGPGGRSKSAEMSPQEFIDLVQVNWRTRLQATLSGSWLEAYCQQLKICTEIALNCMEYVSAKRPPIAAIIHRLNEMETVIGELKKDAGSPVDKKANADLQLCESEALNWREEAERIPFLERAEILTERLETSQAVTPEEANRRSDCRAEQASGGAGCKDEVIAEMQKRPDSLKNEEDKANY